MLEPDGTVPFTDGSAAIGALDARLSSGPADIFRNLGLTMMGLVEVGNGRFGLAFDGTDINPEARRDGFVDRIGGHPGAHSVTSLVRIETHAEASAGIRVDDLRVTLSGKGSSGNSRSASRSGRRVDPIIGMRVMLPLSRSLDLTRLSDAGGFGNASAIMMEAWPTLGFRRSDGIGAMPGDRRVDTRNETGSGRHRFQRAVLTHGPTVGVQFRF